MEVYVKRTIFSGLFLATTFISIAAIAPTANAQLGGLMNAVTGGGSGSSSGDNGGNILRAEELTKELDQITAKIQNSVDTIIKYQAANGMLWYAMGTQINDISRLDEMSNAELSDFIKNSNNVVNAYRQALANRSVAADRELTASDEVLARNTQKVRALRESVATLVDSQMGTGTLDNLLKKDDQQLNAVANAYKQQVASTVALMGSARDTFASMGNDFDKMAVDLNSAIEDAVTQGLILVTEGLAVYATLASDGGSILDKAVGAVRAVQVAAALFESIETIQWMEANSEAIIKANEAARAELAEGQVIMAELRTKLMRSWAQNSAAFKGAYETNETKIATQVKVIEQQARQVLNSQPKAAPAELSTASML